MLRCLRCTRAGDTTDDIRASCGDAVAGIIPCPTPVEVIPGRDIVLTCRKAECGKVFAFPATRIVQHQIPPDVSCTFTSCEIVATQPLVATVAPSIMDKAKGLLGGKASSSKKE